jgi:hypothetical protein
MFTVRPEVIRPCILGWETPKEHAAETGMPMSSIYYKANLFDQAGEEQDTRSSFLSGMLY